MQRVNNKIALIKCVIVIMNVIVSHFSTDVPEVHNLKWEAPTVGILKCNIDGAIFQDVEVFGIGCCLKQWDC